MKKNVKIIIFVITCLWNVVFYHICGYWKQSPLDTFFNMDTILGIVAVIFLALAETSVLLQIYYRIRYRTLQIRTFDQRFWIQCFLLIAYYIGCIYFINILIYDFSIFYISVFALLLSAIWLKSSKTLWTSEGEAYYLSETCVLYLVTNVNENTEMIEISCTGVGYRDRLVSIPQKLRKYY